MPRHEERTSEWSSRIARLAPNTLRHNVLYSMYPLFFSFGFFGKLWGVVLGVRVFGYKTTSYYGKLHKNAAWKIVGNCAWLNVYVHIFRPSTSRDTREPRANCESAIYWGMTGIYVILIFWVHFEADSKENQKLLLQHCWFPLTK